MDRLILFICFCVTADFGGTVDTGRVPPAVPFLRNMLNNRKIADRLFGSSTYLAAAFRNFSIPPWYARSRSIPLLSRRPACSTRPTRSILPSAFSDFRFQLFRTSPITSSQAGRHESRRCADRLWGARALFLDSM